VGTANQVSVSANSTTGAYTLSLPSTINVGTVQTTLLSVGEISIDPRGASLNQVLKFDGTRFAPASDATESQGVTYEETIGNGINSNFIITHNLGTKDLTVIVRENINPYDVVEVSWEATSVNTISIDFSEAPNTNSKRVAIKGPGSKQFYSTVIGDGSNSTIVVNHGLGSRNVVPVIRSVDSPFEVVEVLSYATSLNSVTLDFSTAPEDTSLLASVFLLDIDNSYIETVGNGTDNEFTITHNLDSRDIGLICRSTTSPYEFIPIRWEATTANTAKVIFSSPPTTKSRKIGIYTGLGGSKYFNSEVDLFDGDLIPAVDNLYTLGTSALRWRSISIGGGTLYITDSGNGNEVAVTVANGVFNIDGIVQAQLANVRVTNLTFNDNTVQTTAYKGPSGVGGYYGSFYDTTTQTISNASTAYAMQLSNTAPETNGISITSGSRITFAYAGVYNIQFSAQLDKTDSSTDLVNIWFAKNGTPIDDSNTQVTVLGNNGKYLASWNFMVTVTAGQYIQIMWQSASTAMRLVASSAQTSPTRPAIPSVIVTAVQVA
jgi:hypothetical protein